MGLDLEQEGDAVLRVRKRFLPGGKLAACLKMTGQTPDLLAGFPDEPFVFAAGLVFNRPMADLMLEFSVDAMKAAPKLYGISDEQADRMLKMAGPMMGRLRGMSMMLAVGSPDESLYSRMVVVMIADDARQYMKDYEQYIRQFGSLVQGSKGIFSMKMESQPAEISGREGLEVSMDFPTELMKDVPNARPMLEKMLGPGAKLRAYIVPVDDQRVAIGYTTETLLDKTIDVLEGKADGLSQGRIQVAAAKLEPGNFGVGYISPSGLVDFVKSMAASLAPEGKAPPQIPPFPDTPPIAWSINAKGTSADAQLVIPHELLKAVLDYQGQVRQAFAEKK